MGADTSIEWCHHTFNPWWGCQRVSPGCEHCYAETFAKRVGQKVWGPTSDRRFFGGKHWDEPLKWAKQAFARDRRERVFCASMADVFEDRRDMDDQRARLWKLIDATPELDWLLLTKRPENFAAMLPWKADPWGNVWLGVTAEDQRRADERIPLLLQTPAAVRFVSAEPLLGPIDLLRVRWPNKGDHRVDVLRGGYWDDRGLGFVNHSDFPATLDWVIVGGESGPGARLFDIAWARSAVEQCKSAGAACFVKQLGSHPLHDKNDGDEWRRSSPIMKLRNRKGGDIEEWPADLRVREFPRAGEAK